LASTIENYHGKHFIENYLMKLSSSNEYKYRDWLLCSKSQNSLFCFYSLLFAPCKTIFSRSGSGYMDWKNCLLNVMNHEKCIMHRESVLIGILDNLITQTVLTIFLKSKIKKKLTG